MTDRIMEWLDESQQLADDADYGLWEAYGRGGYGRPRVQSVKSLSSGGIVAHTGCGNDDERAGLDARFIAESRTRFPQAVAALREVVGICEEHFNWQVQIARQFGREAPDCSCEVCQVMLAVTDALGLEGNGDEWPD